MNVSGGSDPTVSAHLQSAGSVTVVRLGVGTRPLIVKHRHLLVDLVLHQRVHDGAVNVPEEPAELFSGLYHVILTVDVMFRKCAASVECWNCNPTTAAGARCPLWSTNTACVAVTRGLPWAPASNGTENTKLSGSML
uniref:(California timema) hypothetical protein n=1 Tax=Timema californicum TaxID=61474 RepID=A0A7R9J158_TIMCA|nr:unnamed protein product [Timema californicum]